MTDGPPPTPTPTPRPDRSRPRILHVVHPATSLHHTPDPDPPDPTPPTPPTDPAAALGVLSETAEADVAQLHDVIRLPGGRVQDNGLSARTVRYLDRPHGHGAPVGDAGQAQPIALADERSVQELRQALISGRQRAAYLRLQREKPALYETVTLLCVDGLSLRTAAARLGISHTAVGKRFKKARMILNAWCKDDAVTDTTSPRAS